MSESQLPLQEGTTTDIDDVLPSMRRLTPFCELDDALLRPLAVHADLVRYAPGDTIVATAQADGTTLYGILSGHVRITRGLPLCGDLDVMDARRGAIIGLPALLSGDDAADPTLSMTAMSDVEVVMIDSVALLSAVATVPTFAQSMLRAMARELRDHQRPMDQDFSPDRRVYRYLWSCTQRRGALTLIDPLPRHVVVAEAAGVTERDAAAAVALLLREGVLKRAFPAAVVEDVARLQQLGQ